MAFLNGGYVVKVALVHYWLLAMRGGEQVLEALCDMYPDAEIFTLFCDRAAISPKLRRHVIHTSALQKLPESHRYYQALLPLMPFALEHFDLSGFELVISSESGPAKGIVPRPDAVHVCYCHTPMRYIWDDYAFYHRRAGPLAKRIMPIVVPMLRQWDVTTAQRVDCFVANSNHVARRIDKYYRRPSTVVFPPVAVDDFAPAAEIGDYYLCAGQLVGYKRFDLAVEAFTRMNKTLVVVGEGPEMKALALKAGKSVSFLGRQSFERLRDLYARCCALVFPGQEDFGIVPVEAMASGRPVIAYGKGGVRDTVKPGITGIFFSEQTVEAVIDAIETFESTASSFDPVAIRAHAMAFHGERFKSGMQAVIQRELDARR